MCSSSFPLSLTRFVPDQLLFLFFLRTGGSPGAHGSLPHSEGQPGGTAAPLHCAGPQTRVGALQRVRTHHQELHPHVHRHQTGVVSFQS